MNTEEIKARLERLAPRFEQLAELKRKMHGQELLLRVVQDNRDETQRALVKAEGMLAGDIQQITDEASRKDTLEGKKEAYELAQEIARRTVSAKVD